MSKRSAAAVKPYSNWDWIVPNRIAQGAYPGTHNSLFNSWDVIVYTAEELQPTGIRAPQGKFVYRAPLDDDIYRPVPPEVGQILSSLADRLAQHVTRGQRVLVTCAMGANRSGLVTGLTLKRMGMSGRSAVDLIKSRRVSGQQEPLSNPVFARYLIIGS